MPPTMDRRRALTLQDWAVIFALIVNVGGLIWAAAKVTSKQDQLLVAVAKLTEAQEKQAILYNDLNIRLSIIEADKAKR